MTPLGCPDCLLIRYEPPRSTGSPTRGRARARAIARVRVNPRAASPRLASLDFFSFFFVREGERKGGGRRSSSLVFSFLFLFHFRAGARASALRRMYVCAYGEIAENSRFVARVKNRGVGHETLDAITISLEYHLHYSVCRMEQSPPLSTNPAFCGGF